MSKRSQRNGEPHPKFKVGDWVHWGIAEPLHLAVVIEDCGIAGTIGNRYYRLREYPLWTDPREYELSEGHLQPAARPEKLPEPHDARPVP
jgi:hypothetical protein